MGSATHASHYRYRIFMLLFTIALINYIDRGALSFAANDIAAEYHFDKVQLGSVLSYFGIGYLVGSVCGGLLADWFGTRRVWLYAGVLWSLFEIASAWAGNIGVMFFSGSALMGFAVIRVLFGLTEGPAYALMNKAISLWASDHERGVALGIGLVSTQVGAMLTAPIAVGLLLLTHDWRLMFLILGVLSLISMAVFAWMYSDTPQRHPRVSSQERALLRKGQRHSEEDAGASVPWWYFFRNRTLVFNALGYFTFLYITFTLATWMPKYLQDNFHYNLHALWYVAMIPWSGACITVILGGKISDWLLTRFNNYRVARNLFAAICLLLTACCFILIPWVHSAFSVVLLMMLGNAVNAMVNNVYWSVVIDVSPKGSVGTFSGMTLGVADLASILSPFLGGVLSQSYGYSAIFVVTAFIALCSMCAMLFLQPEKRIFASA
ncbi:Hexuronate transporter [Halomonadaceae bacterium LMG 33818]|uniref:MFS transporter n=1 Tax=Cernens ardua TaxID=3402176 RepID=UPI003EDC8886